MSHEFLPRCHSSRQACLKILIAIWFGTGWKLHLFFLDINSTLERESAADCLQGSLRLLVFQLQVLISLFGY